MPSVLGRQITSMPIYESSYMKSCKSEIELVCSFVTPHQPLKNDDHFIFKAATPWQVQIRIVSLTQFATIFTLFREYRTLPTCYVINVLGKTNFWFKGFSWDLKGFFVNSVVIYWNYSIFKVKSDFPRACVGSAGVWINALNKL